MVNLDMYFDSVLLGINKIIPRAETQQKAVVILFFLIRHQSGPDFECSLTISQLSKVTKINIKTVRFILNALDAIQAIRLEMHGREYRIFLTPVECATAQDQTENIKIPTLRVIEGGKTAAA